ERLKGPLEFSRQEVEAAVEQHRTWTLWAPMANAALGLWLVASPFTLGLFDAVSGPLPPALGHEVAEPVVRNMRLGVSEMLSGAFIVLFALLGMYRHRQWMQWIV